MSRLADEFPPPDRPRWLARPVSAGRGEAASAADGAECASGESNAPAADESIWLPDDDPPAAPHVRTQTGGQSRPQSPSDAAALELTEFLPVDTVGDIPSCPHLFWHPLRASAWIFRLLFGVVSLVFLLALIAAVPVVNFLALGYLLEAEGRLARTGKLRLLFPLLDLAPRLGSIVLGVWLWLWPLRLLADAAADARVIDPSGGAAGMLGFLQIVAAVGVGLHLCLALARGGSLGCFFRPIRNVRWLLERWREHDYWERAERGVKEFVSGLRLGHHFWLGLRGFVGAAIWLWPPSILFSALQRTDRAGPVLVMLTGGFLLVLVFAWIPFLQARFAAENRFKAMFELRAIRELFCRAPIAWLLALAVGCVLSLPLYLFKIVSPPQDALYLMTPVFVLSIYPARVLAGWAYHLAWAKRGRAWFGFRWICRLAAIPLLLAYVFILFFTPFISEHGRAVLLEHHAFLLPSPF